MVSSSSVNDTGAVTTRNLTLQRPIHSRSIVCVAPAAGIRTALATPLGSRSAVELGGRVGKWPFKPMIRRTESPEGSSL